MTLARRAVAEGLGSALLLATIVGSGIMGERLAAGNTALALLANALATGGGLVALILTFGPISGAHFNPAVTLALAGSGFFAWRDVLVYVAAQVAGALLGVWAAHLMFGLPVFEVSAHARPGWAQGWSEFVASFGLVMVILNGVRNRPESIPYTVAAYIVAAYWFTASTSFANPAVTLARALTDTFSGIRPQDAPMFIAAQLLGTGAAVACSAWLNGGARAEAVH